MYRPLIITFGLLTFSGVSHLYLDATPAPPAEIIGTVDHVLATLPTAQFEAVRKFLSERFADSWMPNRGAGGPDLKGFIQPGDRKTYVELWNAGVYFQYGYGIGVTSADDGARETAQSYFKSNGVEWVKGGLFTIGEVGAIGHPLGGTFLVTYGSRAPRPKNEKLALAELKEVVTAIPPESERSEGLRIF
jgi:hypothetical protein